MYLTIFQSIEKCHLLHFYYDGYFRVVEPHIYGTDRRGRETLCGYQVAGADALGRHIGWKSYLTSRIESLRALDAHFVSARSGLNEHRKWQRIFIRVGPSLPRTKELAT